MKRSAFNRYKIFETDGPDKHWYLCFAKTVGHIVYEQKVMTEQVYRGNARMIRKLTHRDEISPKELFDLDKARTWFER